MSRIPKKKTKKKKKLSEVWIDAWYDPLSSVSSTNETVLLCDIKGEGNYYGLFGNSIINTLCWNKDSQNKVKIFKGTHIHSEILLKDSPISLKCFYNQNKKPILAVGCINCVYMYEDVTKPYFKFPIPPINVTNIENDVWKGLSSGKISTVAGYKQLFVLRKKQAPITRRSFEFLSIGEKNVSNLEKFVSLRKSIELGSQPQLLTCMTTLCKSKENSGAVNYGEISHLVIGTEQKKIIVLHENGQSVIKTYSIPSIPTKMISQGTFDQDYRIIIACRNKNIYILRNGDLSGVVIELSAYCCDLLLLNQLIVCATLDKRIHCFSTRGKKQYSIYLEANVKSLEVLNMKGLRNVKCVIAALDSKELKVFQGKKCIDTYKTHDRVLSLCYGTYGTEQNSLMMNYANGGIEIKFVARKAKFQSDGKTGPPKEQAVPLPLPKKSKLYIEQTNRERKYSVEMHNTFQKDLCKLRLNAAKSFIKILTDGQGYSSDLSGKRISLSVEVKGLGTVSHVQLHVKNTGKTILFKVPIIFDYNDTIYKIENSKIVAPILIPDLEYFYNVKVVNINPETCDKISCYIINEKRTVPLITAIINLPLPEILDED